MSDKAMKYEVGDTLVWQSGARVLEGRIVRIVPAGVSMAEVYGLGVWGNQHRRYASDRYVLDIKNHPKYSGYNYTHKYLDARAQKAESNQEERR
jgi:hypothetical protein